MTYMLCRNRVKDYDKWWAVFDSQGDTQQDTGLKLLNVWRDVEEPNNVFFMFEVTNMETARAFINDPQGAKVGEASGVIDGEFHFVEDA